MAETILLIYYYSRFIDICNTKNIIILQEENIGQKFFCYISKWAKNSKKLQSSLIIFAQRYLCKCKNTYIILQNKYLCIYEDSFGAKILRDNRTLYMFFSSWALCFSECYWFFGGEDFSTFMCSSSILHFYRRGHSLDIILTLLRHTIGISKN